MGIKVGIDLGTTFSVVAKIGENGKAEVIKNRFGNVVTPSVLCFKPNGEILFGEEAKQMMEIGDSNAVAFFKRSMGDNNFYRDFFGKRYNASELSGIFLKKLKEDAEKSCGEKIDSAVITVPAYFEDPERTATKEAGKLAGINVQEIINEPTAAMIAYGVKQKGSCKTALIYDLGGGTFDVTIAKITDEKIDVIGSSGNHALGGKDWDDKLASYISEKFTEKTGEDFSYDSDMVNSALVLAENAKKRLSDFEKTSVLVRYKDYREEIEITRKAFDDMSSYLMESTKAVIDDLFEECHMTWQSIDGVILVGGSTRMKMVHEYVKNMSGKEPLSGVNVDEAVAVGAAIRANAPKKKEKVYLLEGIREISDVTSHSLGMISENETGERYINSRIIPKNSKIPSNQSRTYTIRNNEMEIFVLQGDMERPLDNTITAKYLLTGINLGRNKKEEVTVTYEYTSDGIINVSATQDGRSLKVEKQPIPEDMSWTDRPPEDIVETTVRYETMDVFLSLDVSGSMCGEPIEAALNAMKNFVGSMDSTTTRIGLVPFATETDVELDLTNNYRKVGQTMDKLKYSMKYGGGTSANPIDVAGKVLLRSKADKKYIIILTDGEWYEPEEAIRSSKYFVSLGIEIIAMGFGGADYRFLKKIASTDKMAELTRIEDLSSSFSRIAQEINRSSSSLEKR